MCEGSSFFPSRNSMLLGACSGSVRGSSLAISSANSVSTIGLDIGKNTFQLIGLDKRGAIAMRIKVSRNQLIRRLVNLPLCLIGLEAGSGSHTSPARSTHSGMTFA